LRQEVREGKRSVGVKGRVIVFERRTSLDASTYYCERRTRGFERAAS
jgi:hypothetical protein